MCRTFAKYLFGFLWYKSFYKKKRVWDLCLLFQNVKKIMIHYVYWSEKAKLTFSFLSKHLQLFLLYKFKNHTSLCALGNLQQLRRLPIFHNISIRIKIVAEVNHIPKWRLYHNLPYFRLNILVIYISNSVNSTKQYL